MVNSLVSVAPMVHPSKEIKADLKQCFAQKLATRPELLVAVLTAVKGLW